MKKRTHPDAAVTDDNDDDDELEADDVDMNEDDEEEEDSDNEDDFEAMNINDDEEEEEEEDFDGSKEQRHLASLTKRVATDDTTSTTNNNAFLDSFYGISSSDVRERTMAAQVLIQHCLISSSSSKLKLKLKSTDSSENNNDDDDERSMLSAQRTDAAYALRRLMNGLCSGRAAARQGNAATLASFIKVAISLSRMAGIRHEWAKNDTDNQEPTVSPPPSDLAFLRDALLSVTEPNNKPGGAGGKHRGGGNSRTMPQSSEERDYKLGRLFGLTAMIRSGVLLPQLVLLQSQNESTTTTSTIETDMMNILNDLIQLYHYKKWIREAVAHAICSLLETLHHPDAPANATLLLSRMVEEAILPKLLSRGDTDRTPTTTTTTTEKSTSTTFVNVISMYSAEQIAMAMAIQAMVRTTTFPLSQTILCTETVPFLSAALCSTASTVAPPRTHFVWDILFHSISESTTSSTDPSSTNDNTVSTNRLDTNQRRLKVSIPLLPEGDSVNDLVGAIVESVIVKGLMGVVSTDNGNKVVAPASGNSSKVTQEKYALALTLIRNFMSVPFTSSIIAPNQQSTTSTSTSHSMMKLVLTTEQMETMIWTPPIVRHLFLNVMCTSGKAKSHSSTVLATEVLDQIVTTLLDDTIIVRMATMDHTTTSTLFDDIIRRRLAIAFVLLQCDARFDAKTKTPTVERLLGLTTTIPSNGPDDDTNMNTIILKSTWKPYMTFLEQQIVGDPSTNKVRSNYEIQGYIDLLYQLGKTLSRNTDVPDSDGIQRIYGFLLTVAFFNCGDIETAESTETVTKKKKKNKRQSIQSQSHVIIDIARMIQESRSKSNASPTLPYEVRSAASARFFSLVTDTITTTIHSSSPDKELNIINVLSNLNTMLSHLMGAGAKKVVTITPSDDMDMDADAPPELVVKKMIEDAQASSPSDSKDAAVRWKNGCAILGSTLYLHLFSCGHADIGNDENVDPNADDDEDYEETVGLLHDLRDIAIAYSSTGGDAADVPPLPALAELCARILSSPLGVGNQSRGASPTLLRDAVKMLWTGGLSLSASLTQDDASALDKEVVNVLLNALGAIDDINDENEEDDDEDESDEDDDDVEDEPLASDELQFPNATEIDLDDDKMKVDDDDDDDTDDELHIDPDKLKTLLEEESDADVDEGELEHHEGADAALAKLIQLKQEARKAGTLAKERNEIARQIRCIVLLEALVVGKEGNWGSLLRVDLVMHMMLPILKYRSEVVKSLSKSISKGSNAGSNEKAALLSKLTALLKNKILKAKVSDMEWTETIDVSDVSATFVNAVLKQALDSDDKEHRSLCNSCIMYVLRCIEDSSTKLKHAAVYSEAVLQWSTKRTTRLDSTFFEGLLHQSPVLAQACLTEALATAAMNGRTTYLKSEAFRILSMLYNPKLNAGATDFDRVALTCLTNSTANVLTSITFSLKDTEMKKTKRIRDVLKSAEKVIHFLSVSSAFPPNCIVALQEMAKLLQVIKDDSESHGIVNSVTNLINSIDGIVSKGSGKNQIKTNIQSEPVDIDDDDLIVDMELEKEATNINKDKSKKKKSKKKKK